MAILLLFLLVVAGFLVGDAAFENSTTTSLTIAGQQVSGLSLGGWLLAFTVLGFVSAYLFLGWLAAARRGRERRRVLRSSEREMAERVAELERENLALRTDTPVSHDGDGSIVEPRAPADRPADTLVDTPADDDRLPHGRERVYRDGMGRRLEPPATSHSAVPDSDQVHDHPLAHTRDDHEDARQDDRV